ncbi:MAG: hypothetical protein KBS95_03510 [Alistipes sp.]|nr:hypothetical protein [Candidatus Alistipes equi]
MKQFSKYSPFLALLFSLLFFLAASIRIRLCAYPVEGIHHFDFAWYKDVIVFLLLCTTGIILNRTLADLKILSIGNCQALLLFVMASIAVYVPTSITSYIASFSIAASLSYAVKTINLKSSQGNSFLSFFFIGLAATLEPALAWMAALLIIYCLQVKISFKSIVSEIVAFCLCPFIMMFVKWYTGSAFESVFTQYVKEICTFKGLLGTPLEPTLSMVIMILFVSLGFYAIIEAIPSMRLIIIRRKMVSCITWFFIVLLSIVVFVNCSINMIPIVAAPFAILASISLEKMDDNFSNFIYYGLVLCLIAHLWID